MPGKTGRNTKRARNADLLEDSADERESSPEIQTEKGKRGASIGLTSSMKFQADMKDSK